MNVIASKLKSELKKSGMSVSMIKTYWRLCLYNILREKILLRMVEIDGNSLEFIITPWDEYWAQTPDMFQSNVHNLKEAWNVYIDSSFDLSYAKQFCDAYMNLIKAIVKSRSASFRGLDTLTENLISQWDSRIEQRSHLLAEKSSYLC